jgi:hypothetical protein
MLTAQAWKESIAPLPVSDLRAVVTAQTERQFRETFGNAFLVSGLDPATATIGGLAEPTMASVDIERIMSRPVRNRQWAHMVCSTGRSAYSDFISIGRTRNNDVVMNHPSVSRFHALIVRIDSGLALYDARSRHGSFVDGRKAPTQGAGPPLPLHSCALLRFGSVEATFFDAAGLLASLQ